MTLNDILKVVDKNSYIVINYRGQVIFANVARYIGTPIKSGYGYNQVYTILPVVQNVKGAQRTTIEIRLL